MDIGGAYPGDRAAALSGVPKSTVHYWARLGYLVPSISSERPKLWSFADLMGLRTIYWLRQPKRADGLEIPRTTMRAVKKALGALRALDIGVFERGRVTVAVTRSGEVVVDAPSVPLHTADGQLVCDDIIDLIRPFATDEGTRGPDLHEPQPMLRIVPRKLAGSPHVVDTRIETCALFALVRRGFDEARIGRLYPVLSAQAVAGAIDLERQLAGNLHSSLAA